MLSEQQVYAPSLSGMDASPETSNHISLPISACGVSYLCCPQMAMAGMHSAWRCFASSPTGRYTALVAGEGAPVMNDLAAGMGACMKEPGAGMMNTNYYADLQPHACHRKQECGTL